MIDDKNQVLDGFTFEMLYPPEGSSSILEVSHVEFGDFLQVSLLSDGKLNFSFFCKSEVTMTEDQILSIRELATHKISLTDDSLFEE